jgi:hypothetical protein
MDANNYQSGASDPAVAKVSGVHVLSWYRGAWGLCAYAGPRRGTECGYMSVALLSIVCKQRLSVTLQQRVVRSAEGGSSGGRYEPPARGGGAAGGGASRW